MSRDELQDMYLALRRSIEQIPSPTGLLQPSRQEFLESQNVEEDGAVESLQLLAKHLHLSTELDLTYAAALVHALAEATKQQPLWRATFGIPLGQNEIPYQSILHIALQFNRFSHLQHKDLLKDLLRLIANCCADNNANRKFCLEHDVTRNLIDLAISQSELDVMIPTLYNICVDYQDPHEETNTATSENQQSSDNNTRAINLALEKLSEVLCANCTSFQVLLSLTTVCSEDRRPYLAELVELACIPYSTPSKSNLNSLPSVWQFSLNDREQDTITLFSALADDGNECRLHAVRAISSLLSNEQHRRDFFTYSADSALWNLVTIATSLTFDADLDSDELGEDVAECHKQFLKVFYELTGMPEFISQAQSSADLIEKCLRRLAVAAESTEKSSNENQKICSLVILAQFAASKPVQQQLLANRSMVDILCHVLQSEENNDILYPTITLLSRLCRTDEAEIILVQDRVLQAMIPMMGGKGRGLIIPFEVVNTYKMMIRNRPHYLEDFVKTRDSSRGSIISAVIALFDTTIEAGTKLEVGHFFIEVLRTMFAQVKDLDEAGNTSPDPVVSAFHTLLDFAAVKIGEVLSFVCAHAEPKEQRIHGWFGIGMLSVWSRGRASIGKALEQSDLQNALLEISQLSNSPAAKNANLMLSQMQLCHEQDLDLTAFSVLQNASRAFGFEFRPVIS